MTAAPRTVGYASLPGGRHQVTLAHNGVRITAQGATADEAHAACIAALGLTPIPTSTIDEVLDLVAAPPRPRTTSDRPIALRKMRNPRTIG